MKLLLVTGIFPPDIGGPATYVPRIATALAGRGHQVTVATLSDRLDHDDGAYPFRVVRILRGQPLPLRWARTVRVLRRLAREADVIYVNGLAAESVLASLGLGRPVLQKIVGDLAWERAVGRGWTRDGFDQFQRRRHGPRVAALKALRSLWTRLSDEVIVPSRFLADTVRGWGVPEERIRVVYNAVAPADPGGDPLPLPLRTAVNVVTVGRLVPWKHVDAVIDAVAGLPDVGLVVIGDGPLRGELEARAAQRGAADRVCFAGQRTNADTRRLMRACQVFVLASSYEGLPHIVLEAMQLGLAVVATAAGGTGEVVIPGETGLLVPVNDPAALRDALARLTSDPALRQALPARAAAFLDARFAFPVMVQETEALLGRTRPVG